MAQQDSILAGLLAPLRRRIFLKYMIVTLLLGLVLNAIVLALYREHRRTVLQGEAATEISTIAHSLARPAANLARAGDGGEARALLGAFAAFPYAVCADLLLDGADAPVASWPPIGCERMRKPGQSIRVALPAAGPDAAMAFRIDDAALDAALRGEMATVSALLGGGALLLALSSAGVFLVFVQRPLARLSGAINRFETEGQPERVPVRSPDEIGQVIGAYNTMLDMQVARVGQLRAAHETTMESIGYATRIQRALLPDVEAANEAFDDLAVAWRPRDHVGGDIWWMHRGPAGTTLAVVDCTGHGVPGGFMTMLAVATLERIMVEEPGATPARILGRLSDLTRELLHAGRARRSDDGMDAAICRIEADGAIIFAGARLSLLVHENGEVRRLRGDKQSIGYADTPPAPRFREQRVAPGAGLVVIATDGVIDQIGGPRRIAFGLSRLSRIVGDHAHQGARAVVDITMRTMEGYRGANDRLDDVTVVAFRPKSLERTGQADAASHPWG